MASDRFALIVDLLGVHLDARDCFKLSQVNKSARDAVYIISEEIFSRHEYVQILNRAEIFKLEPWPYVPCWHYTGEAPRKPMLIPLPYGLTCKGKLRAVLEYISYWKTSAVCVHVNCGDIYSSWLFATDAFIRKSIGRSVAVYWQIAFI